MSDPVKVTRPDGSSKEAARGTTVLDFVKNRVAMQKEHMQTVWQKFDGSVRAIVPLFETEIRGVESLRRLASAVFP